MDFNFFKSKIMKNFSFDTVFFIENQNLLITSLRTITSKFLLDEAIYSLDEIVLQSQKKTEKLIEFQKDKNGDILYLEHPKNFILMIHRQQEEPIHWDRHTWYNWIHCLHESTSKLYPSVHRILSIYFDELNTIFQNSINDLDSLYHQTNGSLEPEMIKPYMLLYYQFKSTSDNVNWNKILSPHIDAMTIIFNQIINQTKKEQISLEIFECVKILSKDIQQFVNNAQIFKKVVLNFKKEVHRILNHYTFYLNTNEVNFKAWFLSLSQFFLHLTPVTFSLKKYIVKLNMILFLATNVDELKDSQHVKYISWNNLKKTKHMKSSHLNRLLEVHPFLRNIHHDEIFV